nr:unnamed protein product [Callosobruchus chinensis]
MWIDNNEPTTAQVESQWWWETVCDTVTATSLHCTFETEIAQGYRFMAGHTWKRPSHSSADPGMFKVLRRLEKRLDHLELQRREWSSTEDDTCLIFSYGVTDI